MKANNKGWDQCGNAQAVVDSEKQVIVASDVTNAANDKQQAEPLMSQAQENIGKDETIDKASMDSGYFSEANVVFGQIKRARGFVQFSLRGLEKMRGEWALVCLTHNLLKLFGSQQTAMG